MKSKSKNLLKVLSTVLLLLAVAVSTICAVSFGDGVARADGTTVSVWDGSVDTSWYVNGQTEFTLTTAAQLAGLSKIVNDGNSLDGVTIKLGADIDLNGRAEGDAEWVLTNADYTAEGYDEANVTVNSNLVWNPIGGKFADKLNLSCTIDGQGHTISKMFSINKSNGDASTPMGAGFIGAPYGGLGFSVKNLVFDDCLAMSTTSGEDLVGIVAGFSSYYTSDRIPSVENVTVKNSIVRGSESVGVFFGQVDSSNIRNCTAMNNTVYGNANASAKAIGGFFGRINDNNNYAVFENNKLIGSRLYLPETTERTGLWGGVVGACTFTNCSSDSADPVTSDDCIGNLTNNGYIIGLEYLTFDGVDGLSNVSTSDTGVLQYYVSANAPVVEMKFMVEVSMVDFSINGVTSTAYTLDTTGKVLTIDSLPDSVNDIVFKVSMFDGASELNFRIVTGYTEMPELVRLIDGVTVENSPNFILNHEGFSYIMNSSSADANVLTLSFATPLDENAKVVVTDQNGTYTITGSDVVNLGNLSTIGVFMIEYYYMDVLTYVEVFNDLVVLESLGQDGFYTVVSDEYPWQKVTADDPTNIFGFEYYKSSDEMKGVASSESVFEVFIVGYQGLNYSFTQSGEANYDYLYIEVNGEMTEYKDSSGSETPSELVWTDCTAEFIDNSLNVVRFVYKKDGSGNNGLDQAFIKGLSALDSFDVSSVTTGKIRTVVNGVSTDSEFAINDILEFSFSDEKSAAVFAPVLNQGETCYVYINGEKVEQALSEEMGYYFYNVGTFTARTEVEFVYTRDNTVPFRFLVTLDTLIQGTIQDNLIKSGNVTVSCDDYQDYPLEFDSTVSTADRIAYKSTNSGTDNSVSGLSFTVTESGILSFEYMVSSEANYDIVACAVGTVLTNGNYSSKVLGGDKSKASGVVDWTTFKLPVSVPEGQTVTIHIAYCKDSSSAKNSDMFAIANVELFVGQNTLKYSATNSAAGTITATADGVAIDSGASVTAGSLISLTATPNDGYYFYGWKDLSTGSIIPESTVKFNLIADVEYVAIMELKGAYVLFGGNNYYSTLSEGFASSDETLYLLQNLTISEDITVPQNKTLIIKMSESDKSGYVEGGSYARLPWLSGLSPYITLTIENGKTLTVNGKIIVGGTQHKEDQSGQGHTSGAYSQIVNNGSIVVADGGYLDIIGRLTGNGTLTVNSGATLREPFVVTNYAGGTNTEALYNAGQFPFVQFATVNIDCKQVINHGAKVIGSTSLYFWSSITTQDVVLIDKIENKATSREGALIWLESGSKLEITQNSAKTINTTVGNIHLGDYGVTVIDVYGNITAGEFYLQGYGSGTMVLSVPYTYNFNIKDGATVTISQAYKIMPGAVVSVEKGGTVNITSTGTLYVYDGLIQSDKSGKSYPSADVLGEFGFAKSGMLYVGGTLNIDGAFAGIVQSNQNDGTIVVGSSANVGEQTIVDGTDETSEHEGSGSYTGGYTRNRTVFRMSGRVYGLNGLVQLQNGKTYKLFSEKEYILSTFTVDSASKGNPNNAKEYLATTITLNQKLNGRFLVWDGEKYVAEVTFGIGEAVEGVKVYLKGNLYQTDVNGSFTLTLYFTDRNDVNIAYHGEKSATDYIHVFDFDGEHVLTAVAKAVAFSDTNVYTRKMTVSNEIGEDFVLNAVISFYGSDATETVALTFDPTALTGVYVSKEIVLTSDKLVESLKHDLVVWNSTVAVYLDGVEKLPQSENLVATAIELFDMYNSLLTGTAEDIRLVSDYVGDYTYARNIVKSISTSVVPTYGDSEIDISFTNVDGTTGEGVGNLTAWEFKDNKVTATIVFSDGYKTADYTVSTTCTAKRKNITVTIDGKTAVYGEPTAELTASASELAYDDTFADLGVVLSKADGKNVGDYNISGTWTNLLYQIDFVESTYTITKRNAVVTIDNITTVYGEPIANLTATATGLADGENYSVLNVVLSRENGKNAGEYAITGTYSNNNYNVTINNGVYTISKYNADVVTVELTNVLASRVTKVALTSTAIAPDSNFASTLEYRIEKDGELYATVKNGSWTIVDGKEIAVGSYKVVATTDNANYVIANQTDITLNVVTASEYYQVDFDLDADQKVYDGKETQINPTVKVRDTGRVVSEYEVAKTVDGVASVVKNVGEYLITVTITEENEEIVFTARYTITKKDVVVTIDSKTTVYGDPIVELTATASGLADGEDYSVLNVVLSRENGKNAGEYAITGIYSNANYNVTFVNGVYTISKYEVVVETSELTNVLESRVTKVVLTSTANAPDSNFASTLEYRIEKDGELYATVKNGSWTIVDGKELAVGSYKVVATTDNANYVIANQTDITLRVVTASEYYQVDFDLETERKVYDGKETQINPTVKVRDTGRVVSEYEVTKTVDGVASVVKNVGEYLITVTITEENEENVFKAFYTITKKDVVVTIDSKTTVYGEDFAELTATATGLVDGEDYSKLNVVLSKANGKNAGEYVISGVYSNDNYNVTFVPGTYTISQYKVTVVTRQPSNVMANRITSVVIQSTAVAPDTNFANTLTYRIEKDGELYATVKNGAWSIVEGKTITEGNYTIVATTDNANYIIEAQNTVTLTVVAGNDYYEVDFGLTENAKIYDGVSVSVNPVVKVRDTQTTVTDYELTITVNGIESVIKNVGVYEIKIVVRENGEEVTFVEGYTISPKDVEVKIDNKTTVYGEELVELTATATGLADGEDYSKLNIVLSKANGVNAGEYEITCVYSNANYNVTFVPGVYTITKKDAVVTIDSKTTVYGDPIADLTATATGLANGEDYSKLNVVLSKANGKNVGEYAITGTYSNANYNVTFVNGVYTISKYNADVVTEELTNVLESRVTKVVLTSTAIAPDSNFASTLEYRIEKDGELYATVKNGLWTIVDGKEIAVGSYKVVATTDNANYVIANQTDITLNVVTASEYYQVDFDLDTDRKVYDGKETQINPTVKVRDTGRVVSEYEVAKTVDGVASAVKNVGEYLITVTITEENEENVFKARFTITKKDAVVTIDNKTTVYGEDFADLTATALGLADGEDYSVLNVVLSRENGKNAGEYAITGTYSNNNYNVTINNGVYTISKYNADVVTVELTNVLESRVTKVALTSTAIAPDSNFASTLEYRVEKDGELYATVKNGVWTIVDGKEIAVGSYKVVATTDNANYVIATQNDITLNVVTASEYYQVDFDLDTDGKVYDGKETQINPTVKVRDTGRVVSEYEVAKTVDGVASAVKNVGEYLITVTITEESEENVFMASYTITKKDVVVTIDSKTTVYGEPIADLTASATGLADGEDYSVLSVVLSRENGKNAGEYAITGTYSNANYNVTVNNGVYTITPKTITITIQDKSSNYGDKLLALESSTSDTLPYNESYEGLGIVLKKAEGLSAGEYPITMDSYSNKNYNIVVEKEGLYTINKLDLRVVVDNKTSVYGDKLLDLTYNVTGNFAPNEDREILNPSIRLSGDAKDVGTYAIEFTFDNANYNVTVQNGEYKITQRAITVKVEDITSVYGDREANYVLTILEGSLAFDDDVNGLVELSRETGSVVGEYKIKAVNSQKNANYNVKVVYTTAENSVYTITKRPITLSVASISNVPYTIDWATLAEMFSYSITQGNLVSSDSLTVEYKVVVKDEELDESNFLEKIVGGTHAITMKVVHEYYEITVVDGSLTVSLPTVTLTDKVRGLTFVYGNTQNVFDWRTMISGYMPSASDRTFRAEFFAENDLENPVELDGAGLYKMQIVIVHESEYNFDNGTKRSAYIDVVVTKADITSNISITVEGLTAKGYVVLSFGLTSDASAEGFDVELIKVLQKDGVTVEAIDGVGEYVFTATVDDDNYQGQKSISFKVVESAREKIEKIERTAKLENLTDADYNATKALLSSLTSDDKEQIEDDENAKLSLEVVKTLLSKYVENVRKAIETIQKGYDEYLALPDKPHGRYAIRSLYAQTQEFTDTQKTLLTDEDNALIEEVHASYLSSEKQVSAMFARIRGMIEDYEKGDEEKLLDIHDYIVELQGDDLTIAKESQEGKEYAELWSEYFNAMQRATEISQKVENNILIIVLIPSFLSALAFAVAKMLGM